jgi:diguanylate cyclase (GGDEF)-like protein
MTANEIAFSDIQVEQRTQVIRQDLRTLVRHDWSLWALALLVILSLTATVASLSLSIISDPTKPFYAFHISQSVRSLVGMVLVFAVYTLYQQIEFLRTRGRLGEQIEVAAQQQMRAERILNLAMLDPLTGLHNRHYAQEQLAREVSRAARNKTSLTVLMLDLDDFKNLNDIHGHSMGDAALKIFGKRLTTAIRGSDVAVRLGGDEFVVVLPECKLGNVQVVLDRLSPLQIEIEGKQVNLAVSAGWADYREGETSEELLQRADRALYTNKQNRKRQPHPVA